MWFTENTVAKMGRLTLTGQMQEYPLAPATNATALVVGGDNNLYFLDPAHNAMGSFVPAPPFTVTEFKIPTANALATLPAFPGTMALGFDGRIYFPETAANKIGQFNL
jgi:virginiamycin B lyase